jgi:flagellar biogenesis protein FliO
MRVLIPGVDADLTGRGTVASSLSQRGLAARLARALGFAARRQDRRMELLETLNLGGKRQLMLVECEGKLLLVGAGSDSVQSIVALGDGLRGPGSEMSGAEQGKSA